MKSKVRAGYKINKKIFFNRFLSSRVDLAETVTGKVADNISSVYSILRQTTSDILTFDSLTSGTSTASGERRKSISTSESDEHLSSARTKSLNRIDSPETDSLAGSESLLLNKDEKSNGTSTTGELTAANKEEELISLVTNILFTVLWRGIDSNGGDSWKERGQVMACINLLGLNNELYCSHLTLRLRILEMGVQASLIDLSESGTQNQYLHQQNAAQWLRMIYDLVVLDPNEDDVKKCSPKLMDGVLALMGTFSITPLLYPQLITFPCSITLLDALIVFQQAAADDWTEMSRLCLGLLMKCSHHPNPDVVAMATARLHTILQIRTSQDPHELGYLFFSINKALNTAIEGQFNCYTNSEILFQNRQFFFHSWPFRRVFVFDARAESVAGEIAEHFVFGGNRTGFATNVVGSRIFRRISNVQRHKAVDIIHRETGS